MKRQNRHFVDEGVSPNGILRESSTGGFPITRARFPRARFRAAPECPKLPWTTEPVMHENFGHPGPFVLEGLENGRKLFARKYTNFLAPRAVLSRPGQGPPAPSEEIRFFFQTGRVEGVAGGRRSKGAPRGVTG